jgi:spermidine synthase
MTPRIRRDLMRPFETLQSTTTPEGTPLTLHRRDGDYFIHLDGEELMSTRRTGSESALATLACQSLPNCQQPRILIGGLGFGYTVRAALEALPARARVVVAEIFPAVVAWNRDHLEPLHRQTLEDPRVVVRQANVWDLLAGKPSFDAILLDVDNGPSAWCLSSNSRLYEGEGLEKIRASLTAGGILAVWSAYADSAFIKALGKSGFSTRIERVRDRTSKGAQHTIFIARRPAATKRGPSGRS